MGKAQAGIEFLITYGWALIVVMAVIAALAYFGYLNPERYLPASCTLEPGIACIDFVVESDRIVLVLQNNLGAKIAIDGVEISSKSSCTNAVAAELDDDRKILVEIAGCDNGAVGVKFLGDLFVRYRKFQELAHTNKGRIIAKIGGEALISGEQICQNAEDYGLCGGLDLVYGEGYRATCCAEYTLCC